MIDSLSLSTQTFVNTQGENYLDTLFVSFQHSDFVHYDLKYALRLCAEHNRKEACVHIYSTMELYEEAVELALQVNTVQDLYSMKYAFSSIFNTVKETSINLILAALVTHYITKFLKR